MTQPHFEKSVTVLERSVNRDPGGWCFWIVAVDDSGNRSAPSAMLKGRALRPPPQPPVWVSAERAPAAGTGSSDANVDAPERRASGVSGRATAGGRRLLECGVPWLPRGVYTTDDAPPDLGAAWEYRLRVRDHLSQVASALPTIRLGTP